MKYELQDLSAIITTGLNPRNVSRQKNKAAFIKKCDEAISKEVERIINAMQQELLSCDSEKQIIIYVQKHQHGIIKLLDVLNLYLIKSFPGSIFKFSGLKSFVEEYKKILFLVAQILDSIRNDYQLYFDKSFKVPDFTRLSFVSQLQTVIKRIGNYFANNNVENKLLSFVLQPFQYFINMSNVISQLDYDYIFLFEKEVKVLLSAEKVNASDIFDLLLKINFNDPAFTFHYINKIKFENAEENINAAMKHYYRELKIVNQTSRIPGLFYDHSLLSIQDQLGTWLG